MRTRLTVAAVFAGVAVVLVLVVVVVLAGRFDPSPPSLTRHPVPAIPGEIVYVDEDGCIIRARASGESRERVTCVGHGVGAVSWIDADTIGYAIYRPGQTWTELDLRTGQETVTNAVPRPQPPDFTSVKGERVDFDSEGSLYRINGTERTKILDFDGPEYQRPYLVTWSPDGDWLLLRYKDELWIISRDGSVQGTLAKTRSWGNGTSWWIDGHGALPRVTLQPADSTPVPAPALPGR
jgi:hypothetical protein